MVSRAGDWFKQAERDLGQAEDSRRAGRHEWACFAAHQAAENAVKALHLHLRQEVSGHVVAKLLRELPASAGVTAAMIEQGQVLDTFYIPPRYPNSHPEGRRSSTTARSRVRRRCALPVRSLTSSVTVWPDRPTVEAALRRWAEEAAPTRRGLRRVGYFGSYARGDWGVGSDLDVVLVVSDADLPFERRAVTWDLTRLPVPADTLVYTEDEWRRLDPASRFARTLAREVVWVWQA